MTTLSLYPARIRFVNADGTLTPEAYRALQILFGRVGGALGDMGTDMSAVSSIDVNQIINEAASRETLIQPASVLEQFLPDVVQPVSVQPFYPDVVQPSGSGADNIVVKAGSASEPSISTEGDSNTGLFFPGADKVALTVAGAESFRVDTTGIAIDSTKKIFLDGVDASGNTYLSETSYNTVDLYVGGTKMLTVTTSNIDLNGHVKIESVTSTGATGSGKVVFNDSPTLITPNLGGYNGTVTPVTSITVANGVVTSVS